MNLVKEKYADRKMGVTLKIIIRMKLGAMFCHSDVINFGSLPYTDFRRSKTLCQGGDCCDFDFVRYETDAGDGWERTESV